MSTHPNDIDKERRRRLDETYGDAPAGKRDEGEQQSTQNQAPAERPPP